MNIKEERPDERPSPHMANTVADTAGHTESGPASAIPTEPAAPPAQPAAATAAASFTSPGTSSSTAAAEPQENASLGYLIKNINDKMKAKADAELKEQGLTFTQSRVLCFVESGGGYVGQKEIEADLKVSHPTVAGLVQRMEQKGLLKTKIDPRDRRNKLVSLTDKAVELGRSIEKVRAEHERRLLNGLSEAETAELKRMLGVIYGNLCASGTEPDWTEEV